MRGNEKSEREGKGRKGESKRGSNGVKVTRLEWRVGERVHSEENVRGMERRGKGVLRG